VFRQSSIEYLFENPSGKGWWSGNSHATFKVSRQDKSPACSRYNVITLQSLGVGYHIDVPDLCSFSYEFKQIPVFSEERIRLACGQALAGATPVAATRTWQENVEIQARYRPSAGGEAWETVAVLPMAVNLRCEAELKPHK
jgi:hypothetical protein